MVLRATEHAVVDANRSHLVVRIYESAANVTFRRQNSATPKGHIGVIAFPLVPRANHLI
jgi:hypothetical protein